MTAAQKREFISAYALFLAELIAYMKVGEKAQLDVLAVTPLTAKFNMTYFAREALLHSLKNFHDYHNDLEVAVRETDYIANPG